MFVGTFPGFATRMQFDPANLDATRLDVTFEWTPGARPLLFGRATVHRLKFGVGGGQWSDTRMIPDAIAIATRVVLVSAAP